MSESYIGRSTGASKIPHPLTCRIATWLPIAAAPTFAAMAIITTLPTAGNMEMMCGADPSSLGGMGSMYLLMSVFHSAPWLKLIGNRLSRETGRPTI